MPIHSVGIACILLTAAIAGAHPAATETASPSYRCVSTGFHNQRIRPMGYVLSIVRLGPGIDSVANITWEEWMAVVAADSTLRPSPRNRLDVVLLAPDTREEVELRYLEDSWADPDMRDYPRRPAGIGFNAAILGAIEPVVTGIARRLRANIVGEEGELYYTFANDSLIADP